MPDVKHVNRHTTSDGFLTTTVSIGVVDGDGVYVLKKITTPYIPNTYDKMVSCVAASMEAMRGQYSIVEDRATQAGDTAWDYWFRLAMSLTWSTGDRYVLYKINPINGLPALIDCNFSVHTGRPTTLNKNYTQVDKCFDYVKKIYDTQESVSLPYHAFSDYGATTGIQFDGLPALQHGIDAPLVANQHMKLSDSPELHWVNVGMHMVSPHTRTNYAPFYTMPENMVNIANKLLSNATAVKSTSIATQVMAPYPVQWRTSQPALAQAMQVATAKLVGEQNYKKFFGPPGSAMNVAMGAAYFVMRPHTNQMHLKAMYTQDDKVMPLASGNAAFVRDITPTGVRNRYLQALMLLGVG